MADLDTILAFLEQQKVKQAKHFPTVHYDKVLSFMGTTSLAGTRATVGVCPIRALEPAGSPQGMTVRLRGPLPRPPARGECVTVHVTNIAQFQGYQIKTRPVGPEPGPATWEERGDELVVHGSQIFTVHHSPYTMRFFEQIPFEEVHQIVGHIPFALVAVGETANLSPRFIFHHEVQQGRLVLYHGDGLALKTYVNLKSNRQETRLVLDLDDLSGWALRATVEEFQPHQHPEAYDRICQGFTAGDWGKPSRTFRSLVEAWEPVAPTGPALRG